MGAAIIAHGDASPILEPPEHIFNLVPLFVYFLIVLDPGFAVLLRRYAGRDATPNQRSPEPVSVISTIRQQY